MKVSNQLLVSMVILFGVSLTANAKSKKAPQKIYKVEACDCVGEQDGIPTFLSELAGNTSIDAKSKTLAKAEAKANKKCQKGFKGVKGVRQSQVSISGCRKLVSIAGTGNWKEF